MKVLLINPKSPEDINNNLPLGLCYLAAALEKANHEVFIADMNATTSYEELIDHLLLGYDIVGITTCDSSIFNVLSIAKLTKQLSPYSVVVLGGPNASFTYELILESNYEIDYVIIGQGEISICRLANELNNLKTPIDIPGIAYRNKEGKVIVCQQEKIVDIDSYPIAVRHLTEHPIDRAKRKGNKQIIGELIISRGCKGNCTFCSCNIGGSMTWCSRNIESVQSEINSLIKMGVDSLYFVDVDFFANKQMAKEIILYINNSEKITNFYITTRSDSLLLNKDVFEEALEAGLRGIEIGIESGSQSALDRYNKKVAVQQNEDAIKLLLQAKKRYSFIITCDMIMFDPLGKYSELMDNLLFLKNNNMYNRDFEPCLFTCLSILHGSTLYQFKEKKKEIGCALDTPYISFSDKSIATAYSFILAYKMQLLHVVEKMRNKITKLLSNVQNNKNTMIKVLKYTILLNTISFNFAEKVITNAYNRNIVNNIYIEYKKMIHEWMIEIDEIYAQYEKCSIETSTSEIV